MGISLNLELMLLVFFLFILCVILLNKWLYKPILEFMDSRDNMIKNDLENSNSNDSEIEAIQSEINIILDNAKKEAALLKERAHTQAKLNYDKNIQEVKNLNEKDLVNFMETIKKEKEELYQSLLTQVPDFKKNLNVKLKKM